MILCYKGLRSGYELLHITKLFFSAAKLNECYRQNAVGSISVRLSTYRIFIAINTDGINKVLVRKSTNGEFQLYQSLFLLLCNATKTTPPFGMLTGVRPVSLLQSLVNKQGVAAAIDVFQNDYFVSGEKILLVERVRAAQLGVVAGNTKNSYSLYVSIPFCPTRCSYCSFVSTSTHKDGALIAPYLKALHTEISLAANFATKLGLRLRTIYIGGGTPTSISPGQLQRLMAHIKSCFNISLLQEYTVEAGRADCTTAEKLAIIKEFGATRISINPQSFSEQVLQNIGRAHSGEDVIECYEQARQLGHKNINMDFIAGLPGEGIEGFKNSLEKAVALSPENITVHSLSLKRAGNITIKGIQTENYQQAFGMMTARDSILSKEYTPYYLYRQKNTPCNLENVGYAKDGFLGLYNIYIMEELHSIFAVGAGAVTKLKNQATGRIERIFNYKYPTEYIKGIEQVRAKKSTIEEFYNEFICT